tara:strand:+ start:663 stop:1046 length:384 start_codon:yes stop_codon:yes gene_type:complete
VGRKLALLAAPIKPWVHRACVWQSCALDVLDFWSDGRGDPDFWLISSLVDKPLGYFYSSLLTGIEGRLLEFSNRIGQCYLIVALACPGFIVLCSTDLEGSPQFAVGWSDRPKWSSHSLHCAMHLEKC